MCYTTAAPKMENDTQLSAEQQLESFSNAFNELIDSTSTNFQLTNDAVKKAQSICASNEDLVSEEETLHQRIVEIADRNQSLQTLIAECSDKAEKLIKRCDRIYGSIPKEKLSDYNVENEARLFKSKKAIDDALAETRDASIKAILLRAEHVQHQPSFQSSVGAARFMLTKNGLSTEELKDEVDKLATKVGKLFALVEYAKQNVV